MLRPRPARATANLASRPPTIDDCRSRKGLFFRELLVELTLGPAATDDAPELAPIVEAAAQSLAATDGDQVPTISQHFNHMKLAERHAFAPTMLSEPSRPQISEAFAEGAKGTPLEGLPLKARVLSEVEHTPRDIVFAQRLRIAPGKSPLGIGSFEVDAQITGFSWFEVDWHWELLNGPSAQFMEQVDRIATTHARRAGDLAGFEATFLPYLYAFVARYLPLMSSGLTLALAPDARPWLDKAQLVSGQPGVVEREGGGATLSTAPDTSGDGAGVRSALVIDNADLGGRQHPGGVIAAREAPPTLTAAGFEVTTQQRASVPEIMLAFTQLIAGALPGDQLRVVYSGPLTLEALDYEFPMTACAELTQFGKNRGIAVTIDLDIPEGGVAEDARLAVADVATVADGIARLQRIAPQPEDPPHVLRLIALANEFRMYGLDVAARRYPRQGALDQAYRSLVRLVPGIQVSFDCESLVYGLRRLNDAIAAQRHRPARGEKVEYSFVAGATDHAEYAPDHSSYTQKLLEQQHDGPAGAMNDAIDAAKKMNFPADRIGVVDRKGKYGASVGSVEGFATKFTKRSALVIGNGHGYALRGTGSGLLGAARDAQQMAARWKGDGYTVESLVDVGASTMNEAIQAHFAKADAQTDVAFYYAGHGETLGLTGVDGDVVRHTSTAAAAGRAKQRGAKVTMILDACQVGDGVTQTIGAMEGHDHLPLVPYEPGDTLLIQAFVGVARYLRDVYLTNGSSMAGPGQGAVRDDVARSIAGRLAKARVTLAVPITATGIALTFREIEQRLIELRAEAKKRAWLDTKSP